MKKVYLFDSVTHAYMGDYDAQESPLEPGIYIEPTYSTSIAPTLIDGTIPIFSNGEWSNIEINPGQGLENTPDQPIDPRLNMIAEAWQIKRALTQLGLRQAVEDAVSVMSMDVKDMWEYATIYYRTSPFVAQIAQSLNKTDAEIDDLFVLARSIT